MKKVLSLGFSALALIAVSLFGAANANAAPVCTTYSVPPQTAVGQWPLNGDNRTSNPEKSFMYNCTTADPNGDWAPIWEAAQAVGNANNSTALAQLFTDNHVRIYYVDDVAAYNAVFGTNLQNPPAPAILWGLTITQATPNVPLYASVVLRNPPNLGKGAVPNDVHGVIMHELGHDYDLIWGAKNGGKMPSLNSTRFQQALAADKIAFNKLGISVAFKSGKILNSCKGQSNYNILQCEFFQGLGNTQDDETKEAWAMFFGMYVGNSDNYWLDDPSGIGSDLVGDLSDTGNFQNVRAYMQGLRNGSSPF